MKKNKNIIFVPFAFLENLNTGVNVDKKIK